MTLLNTPYRLVIFDWDGTLLDSAADIVACMQCAIKDLGLPAIADQSIRHIIGLGLKEAVAKLYPGLDDGAITQLRERYSHHFLAGDYSKSQFFPAVETTLRRLHGANYKLAIATGKSRKGLDRVLGSLDWAHLFHASRCADETRSKPHPQMLHELLDEFQLVPEQALMVGDTEYDLAMAAALDMDSVAVSYGAHDVEHLERFEPKWVIDSLAELGDQLLTAK